MTIVEDMLRWVARVAGPLREIAAPDATVAFLQRQMNDDGGFKGRGFGSDLYYTVFGLQALRGLEADVPLSRVREFLEGFGDGEELDLVHLGCLTRAWWLVEAQSSEVSRRRPGADARRAMWERVATFRSADGGFALLRDEAVSSVYATFMAVAAYQDAGVAMPDPDRAVATVWAMHYPDGGFANDAVIAVPTTPATAAAIATLRHLGHTPPESAVRWLLDRADPEGGFFAFDGAPEADLLSTATTLYAIAQANLSATAQADVDARLTALSGATGRFLGRLWTPDGGFRGSLSDDIPDTEYTFYGLLALGHL